jgi:hypothetical protein
MAHLDTGSLMDSISQLLEVHPDVLHVILDEICRASIPYTAVYNEF